MKRKILLFILLLIINARAFATHERAGNITFSHVSGYTYEVLITTYTRSSSPADRPSLDSVYFGDGTMGSFPRHDSSMVSADIRVNHYYQEHTYPGPDIYIIHFEDPNRNADVVNIPNSVNVPFYCESELIINPFTPFDNSPVFTQPPIDFGCANELFTYNPGAFDVDGDSLSYELVPCKGAGGLDIFGYTFPGSYTTISFSLDSLTGEMTWNNPNTQGAYNVAFKVHEWRRINNTVIEIGYVKQDMQIYIGGCNNNPPMISTPLPQNVYAGDTVKFTVCAHDPDGQNIDVHSSGSTFTFNPDSSTFTLNNFNNDTVCGTYSWVTSCARVRTQPYHIVVKAFDITMFGDTSLSDLQDISIRVAGPPPLNATAVAASDSIFISWQSAPCISNVVGYRIYRGMGPILMRSNASVPCGTDLGLAGYNLIAYVNGSNDTTYADRSGLSGGTNYCYLITAVYNTVDSAQSCASAPACAIATGLNDLRFGNEGLTIYPNPAQKAIIVRSSTLHAGTTSDISIMNVLGEIKQELKLNLNKETSINIDDLPSGVYIVMLTGEQVSMTGRFIKE